MVKRETQKKTVEARRAEVARLCLRRLTREEIAEQLDVHPNTISSDLKALRKQWADTMAEGRDFLVTRELQHIDSMERQLMEDFENADVPTRATYMARMTGLLDRRMKLLGLEQSPGKNAHGVPLPEEATQGGPIRIEFTIIPTGNRDLVTNRGDEDDIEGADDADDTEDEE